MGLAMVFHTWIHFTLIRLTPLYSFSLPSASFQQLSMYFHIPPSYTDAMYLSIAYFLSFSLSLLPPPVLSNSSTSSCMFYLSLYICTYDHVFMYIFIFYVYLPHMRENIWPLSLWNWLTFLIMMVSSYIHSPADGILSFFSMVE
jgi:hypothetical protein